MALMHDVRRHRRRSGDGSLIQLHKADVSDRSRSLEVPSHQNDSKSGFAGFGSEIRDDFLPDISLVFQIQDAMVVNPLKRGYRNAEISRGRAGHFDLSRELVLTIWIEGCLAVNLSHTRQAGCAFKNEGLMAFVIRLIADVFRYSLVADEGLAFIRHAPMSRKFTAFFEVAISNELGISCREPAERKADKECGKNG